jgi:hypothetical protein
MMPADGDDLATDRHVLADRGIVQAVQGGYRLDAERGHQAGADEVGGEVRRS